MIWKANSVIHAPILAQSIANRRQCPVYVYHMKSGAIYVSDQKWSSDVIMVTPTVQTPGWRRLAMNAIYMEEAEGNVSQDDVEALAAAILAAK